MRISPYRRPFRTEGFEGASKMSDVRFSHGPHGEVAEWFKAAVLFPIFLTGKMSLENRNPA
jgi:hypothetical protein